MRKFVVFLLLCLYDRGLFLYAEDSPDAQAHHHKRYTKIGFLNEVTYFESNEHLINPSRGFGQWMNTRESSHSPLSKSRLERYRNEDGIVLVRRAFIMDQSVNSDTVSAAFIDEIRRDLDIIRQVSQAPYGDPTKDRIFKHIVQLAPIIEDYEDIIDCLQAGFIGIWGEWYYTTYFGDPNFLDWSDPDNIRGMTPQHWEDRRQVLSALLDATPKSIQVQARIPLYKRVIHRDWTPTTEQEMTAQTNKARTAQHNDCFLANAKDSGTYLNKSEEYAYMSEDNLYSIQGGETCRLNVEGRHLCPTALEELEGLRWTFLNQAYNRDVLQTWKDGGCYGEIHRRLGYRLVLKRSVIQRQVAQNEQFEVVIDMENKGYAPPYKTRDVRIVLRQGDAHYSAVVSQVDTRLWFPGQTITIRTTLEAPANLPLGFYQVLVAVGPAHEDRSRESDYYILMANRLVPEYANGLNDLFQELEVTASESVNHADLVSSSLLLPWTPPSPSQYNRLYCEWGGCKV